MEATSPVPKDRQTSMIVLIALLAASIEPILVRLGYRGSATPAQLWLARAVVAGIVVVPVTRSLKSISRAQFKAILGVGPLLLVTAFAGLMALKTLPVAISVTAMSTTPALVAVGNQMLGRDQFSIKFWLGFLFCILGVATSVDFLSVQLSEESRQGLMFVIIAMMSSTIYRLRLEGLTKIVEPQVASTWFFVVNGLLAVLLMPLSASLDGASTTLAWLQSFPVAVFYIAAWAGVASVLANIMFVRAVKILGSTRMSIFDLLQRPLVILFAAVLLGEAVSLNQILGFLLVVLGVHMAKVKRK